MPRILAIDDKATNLTDLKYKLKFGLPDVELITTTNAAKGLEMAITETPDVILLDIIMPGIDGFEVCKRLKSNTETKDIPVIFLTVLENDKETRIKALEAGGDALLNRPVDEIELKIQLNAMFKIRASYLQQHEEKETLKGLVKIRTQELEKELEKRKKTEVKLRENEEKYRELVENSPDLIYIVSTKYGLKYGTKQVEQILGYKYQDMKNDPLIWFMLVHPEDRYLLDKIKSLNFEGNSFEIEYRIKDIDGNWHWFRDRSIKRTVIDDEVIIHGIITDITENKKDFKELCLHNQRQEALLKIFRYSSEDSGELLDFALEQAINLTESINGILFIYDDITNKVSVGSCSKTLKGTTEKSDLFFDLNDIGIWSDAVKKSDIIIINDSRQLEDTFCCIQNTTLSPKNLMAIPVQIGNKIKVIIGLTDKDGNYSDKDVKQISLLFEAVWTIVERKKHIEELKTAKEKAEESERLKSAFLANMSHEIRTPMNGIMGFAELLKVPDLSEQERQDYLGIIEKSGERMLSTLNDLIDISKIESKLIEVNLSEFNLNDQMHYLYHFFKLETKNKGLQLTHKNFLKDNSALIISDKDKVNAILMNLIKNSIKYTKQGEIEFGYLLKESYLEFYVKDTGIGIAKERQEAIFERFVQADVSISRPYEGVGLGLSIAKAYVEMLNGTISLNSELNKGSLFSFIIPYKTTTVVEPELHSRFNSESRSEDILNDLNILVAEDDDTARMYMQHLLTGKCNSIIFAKNGKEAVDLYKANPKINLILMDMKMPEMDGYIATKRIKEINKDITVIGQSAFALPGDEEKSAEAGCDDYITKPIQKEQLLNTIHKHFGIPAEIHE